VPRHGQLDVATRCVVTALQRHFRPERVDGALDQETLARLDGLLALL
jgi:N-acetyl-anhydromuramyl-L-alanine amidase AmpD